MTGKLTNLIRSADSARNELAMPLARYNLRQFLIGVTLFAGIVLLGRFVVWPLVYPLTPWHWDRVTDIYALWQTEEMLSTHLARSNGELPTSWEDLTDEFDITNQSHNFPGIESLQERVLLDFDAMRKASLNPPPEGQIPDPPVLRLQREKQARLSGTEVEVNERLAPRLRIYEATNRAP
jgi:hypothetical protein